MMDNNIGKAIRISISVGREFYYFQIVDVMNKDGIEVITLSSQEFISLQKEDAPRKKYSKCKNMYSLEQKYLLEKRSGEKITISEHQLTIYYVD